ncbi:MAG: CPBP family intramembrane glutamic endopeptidase [Vicinamibacterales bacterium]
MVEASPPPGPPAPEPGTADPLAEPARRPARAARLIALAEVLLCSGLPTQLVVQLAVVTAGVQPWHAEGVPALAFLATTQILDAALLIGVMAVLTRAHGERAGALWRGTRPGLREIGLGVALIPVVLVLVAATLGLAARYAPWLHNVAENPFETLIDSPARAALMVVVVIVAGGLREELQRAFLLHRFERHLGGPAVGVVVLSAAFGAGHYVQGWDAMVATGVVGAFWAVLYLRRRSVIAPVVSHAGFDVLQVLGTLLA